MNSFVASYSPHKERPSSFSFLPTSGTRNDSLPPLVRVQVRHLVVGAAQLEAEDGQQILPLQHDFALIAIAQIDRVRQGRLVEDLIYARRQDES